MIKPLTSVSASGCRHGAGGAYPGLKAARTPAYWPSVQTWVGQRVAEGQAESRSRFVATAAMSKIGRLPQLNELLFAELPGGDGGGRTRWLLRRRIAGHRSWPASGRGARCRCATEIRHLQLISYLEMANFCCASAPGTTTRRGPRAVSGNSSAQKPPRPPCPPLPTR